MTQLQFQAPCRHANACRSLSGMQLLACLLGTSKQMPGQNSRCLFVCAQHLMTQICRGFADMVMYIEACEAGSMFEGMLNDSMNIYTTTAANAHESSWATYCPGMSPAAPTGFTTCLGDLYSVSWMENRYVHHHDCAIRACVLPSTGFPPALWSSLVFLWSGDSYLCHHCKLSDCPDAQATCNPNKQPVQHVVLTNVVLLLHHPQAPALRAL